MISHIIHIRIFLFQSLIWVYGLENIAYNTAETIFHPETRG